MNKYEEGVNLCIFSCKNNLIVETVDCYQSCFDNLNKLITDNIKELDN